MRLFLLDNWADTSPKWMVKVKNSRREKKVPTFTQRSRNTNGQTEKKVNRMKDRQKRKRCNKQI